MSASQHYTFGDNDVAAHRLGLLAAAYEESSREFLRGLERETAPGAPVRVAIDLGCGLGYTTELLADTLRAPMTVGLDNSPRHLARARQRVPAGVTLLEHDLVRVPFPVEPADVLYGRFVLTHLSGGLAVVDRWAAVASAGARLALEEVDTLAADDEDLRRYYALVEALQTEHGQRTYVGREVAELPGSSPWMLERLVRRPVRLPAAVAARLHALNFETWRHEPFIAGSVPAAELDRLGASLEALATGARLAAPVRWVLAQAVLRRR
jgi:trans-aconitate 2-methyltransferase